METPLPAASHKKIIYSLVIAKIPLCLMIAFSALFGNIFAQQIITFRSIFVFVSVLFLACGGASINSYQERVGDGLMTRTAGRPLVRGWITNQHAILQGTCLVAAGLMGLFLFSNTQAFVAGIAGIITYNMIYTRMKPWSIHAILPGAICGAIPPYIGWLAANGDLLSFRAMLPVLLLVFWQIPHFFLVLLNHKTDYLDSISPNLLKSLSEKALQRIFLPWITALAATMLTICLLSSFIGSVGRLIIVANTMVLIFLFYRQILFYESPNYKNLFRFLNFSIFLVMLIVCVSGIDLSG